MTSDTSPAAWVGPSTPAFVDVVLPCLDEALALPWVLSRLPAGYRAVVADNGSVDGSPEIARRHGALVVHVAQRGYGAACHAGLLAAGADVVVVMDADGSLDPADLPALCRPVVDGAADLVVGRRRATSWKAWSASSRVANAALARAVRRRSGVTLRDLGPVRVARREALLGLSLTDRRSGYPVETVVMAARAGWRIAELPVTYRPRSGRSKVTGTVGGYLRAVRDMSAVLAR